MPRQSAFTVVLIGLSGLVYFLTAHLGQEWLLRLLIISEYYSPVLPEIKQGELWRLVTPIFLHFGLTHIVLNLVATWMLGQLIEWRQGALMLAGLTALLAIVSNLAQYIVSGPVFGGISGVVYGYFGYLWIQGRVNPRFGALLHPTFVTIMLGWFLICWSGLLEKLLGVHIANTAHTAGLVCGMVAALAFYYLSRFRQPR